MTIQKKRNLGEYPHNTDIKILNKVLVYVFSNMKRITHSKQNLKEARFV